MRIVEHALDRLGVIRVGIMIFDVEVLIVDHDTAEGHELAEFRNHVSALIPIDEGLIFDINNGDHRVLQATILTDFDGLQEPLIPINQFLVWVLGTKLGVWELRE